MNLTRVELTKEQRNAEESFARLAASVDEFEAYAHPHATRIATISDEIAKLFHLGIEDRWALRVAAFTHDLGEAALKRDYIRYAGELTIDERLDLARHPVIGETELANARAPRAAQLLVRWHHEWWNGAGYPDSLREHQIPLPARILRVADSYAALTDARPFRAAQSAETARQTLIEWSGLEFDPQVVRAFLSLPSGSNPAFNSYAVTPRAAAEDEAEADEQNEFVAEKVGSE
ncbi:MAG: HD domain-containing protein [Pyrinomonadaceae bacterium]|nr:HD domain-containing protein [Pyrinomonadaceae bacterium]